jgi:hypothetical protein
MTLWSIPSQRAAADRQELTMTRQTTLILAGTFCALVASQGAAASGSNQHRSQPTRSTNSTALGTFDEAAAGLMISDEPRDVAPFNVRVPSPERDALSRWLHNHT